MSAATVLPRTETVLLRRESRGTLMNRPYPIHRFIRGGSRLVTLYAAAALLIATAGRLAAQTDPLPSWNDGPAKKAIVDFVQATTTQGSPTFVPPAERIATFDNDGTLWVEHPMYTQVLYCLDRVPALVRA